MSGPHVLLICTDHWPGTLLHAAGNEHILTPTLDSLCASGIRYSRAVSSVPTCIPARRELMTGTTAKTHGDRVFNETLPMKSSLSSMAQVFSQAGYQTYAVGKLHVYPQRDRIGFYDVLLNEEGRHHLGGGEDDYELYLKHHGYAGEELVHGMGNNHYCVRPWHLPEAYHPTYWTTREMCRQIQRRDPLKPGFWYCSYTAPHPPLTPPGDYLSMYLNQRIDMPVIGSWAEDYITLPYALKSHMNKYPRLSSWETALAKKAFYAQCTYIDHQIRLLIGTLREEGLLDNTVILFTSDHGDMLGNHGLWAKTVLFNHAVNIPLVLSVPPSLGFQDRYGSTDARLAALRDIMPTLLELCGIAVPGSVEGMSLLTGDKREYLYGEHCEDEDAMRMVMSSQYKLIWYPVGNRFQLFDLESDPMETENLIAENAYTGIFERLAGLLADNLYGTDRRWIDSGRLVGEPDIPCERTEDRTLRGQRGWR